MHTETNDKRRYAGQAGGLSADQRLAVATRIAATTVFTNRLTVWDDVDDRATSGGDIAVHQIAGGRETAQGTSFEVDEATLQETLGTGLFSAAGPPRLRWAHQTFAEFLAAYYLVRRRFSPPQIMSLLTHPEDPEGKIVPQLRETAAWLVGQESDVLNQIIDRDPEVLLGSDVVMSDPAAWATVVEHILAFYNQSGLSSPVTLPRDRLGHLGSAKLVTHVRLYLTDRTKHVSARYFAVDVAEACNLREVQAALAAIALDRTEPLLLRTHAAWAIYRKGDTSARARLIPLVAGPSVEDPRDDLKGWSLRACWPDLIDAAQVLAGLAAPQRSNYIGAYKHFLDYDLSATLRPADIPVALSWMEDLVGSGGRWPAFEMAIVGIVKLAWAHIDQPGVLPGLARSWGCLIHEPMAFLPGGIQQQLRSLWCADSERRRALLNTLLPLIGGADDIGLLASLYSSSHDTDDLPFLIQTLECAKPLAVQTTVLKLIDYLYDRRSPRQTDVVLTACEHNSILADAFQWLREPVTLGSPEALKMKADHERWLEISRPRPERPPVSPSPAARILENLDRFETGNLAAWWVLNQFMLLDATGAASMSWWESSLTQLPGWRDASPSTRARLVAAAQRYVMEYEPRPSLHVAPDAFHRPGLAGYRALRLLQEETPDLFLKLPKDVWSRWATTIVAYPLFNDSLEQNVHHEFLRRAYDAAPEAVIGTLLEEIDREHARSNSVSVTTKMASCWDDRLQGAVLAKAQDPTLTSASMASLLIELLTRGMPQAREFAEALVNSVINDTNVDEQSHEVAAATALLLHTADAGWSVVWPAMVSNPEFGRAVVEGVADPHHEEAALWQRLDEAQVAELYIWLVEQYPHSQDPDHQDAHYITSREQVAQWRDALLTYLRAAGTPLACEAVTRIQTRFPELSWLRQVLADARTAWRRAGWNPPTSEAILALARSSDTRLVMNGDQLLDVIVESLGRLVVKLQGETPQAKFLWDMPDRENYRPKDETALTDFIKAHLDADLARVGVVVNREVVIREGTYPNKGERTDIHVDAVSPAASDTELRIVKAVIEVKGCWNKGLKHAMRTQLLEQYLRDSDCNHGLYLVGWFNCPQWNPADPRRKRAPKWDLVVAGRHFDEQALSLCSEQKHIKSFVLNAALR